MDIDELQIQFILSEEMCKNCGDDFGVIDMARKPTNFECFWKICRKKIKSLYMYI